MTLPRENEQKLARMASFIECARELIEEEGYNNVSIRKIAEKAGFHNSTIYFYFSDLDYLLALASVRSLEEYSKELAAISLQSDENADVFYPIWESFCRFAFEKPDQYYQFFFGKYKDLTAEILNQYYRLFPEEKQEYSAVIEEMYFSNGFFSRCRAILVPLSDRPDTRVTEATIDIINTLIVSVFESFLEKKCAEPDSDTEMLTADFMSILHFVVDA